MFIAIDTATMSNEVLARLAAVISDATIEAHEQARRTGWTNYAEDYHHNDTNARTLVNELIARAGHQEAEEMADAFGIDPEFFDPEFFNTDAPTLEQIADAARDLGLAAAAGLLAWMEVARIADAARDLGLTAEITVN